MTESKSIIRNKKIIKTAWSGLASKILTMGVSLAIVPLTVHYLGKEQYGVWIAVSSLVSMLGFMDGGAGNAVLNMIAHASAEKQNDIPKIVSTAFFSLMAVALIGCLLFLGVLPFVPWSNVLGIADSVSVPDLNIVVLTVGLFFFVSIFLTLVGKIQRGLQEGNLDNFWSGAAALLSLLFVYIAIQKDAGLLGYVVAFLAGPLLAYLASNIHYLFISRKDLRPRFADIESAIAKNLFAVGGLFFVLQIAVVIQGQADNVIIANMLGPAVVTTYSICMKLFLIPPMLFGLILTPLWPAYREAFAGGDMQWVKRIFLKSMRWSLLISIPSAFILVMLGEKIIELWVGHEAIPSIELLVGCGMWLVFSTVGGAIAVLLNGLQLVKVQLIAAISTAIMNLSLTILLIPIIGVAGAVFGSVVAWFFCSLIPYIFVIRKIFIKTRRR
jgi:O-antigen/teichoic acid export membrane protein